MKDTKRSLADTNDTDVRDAIRQRLSALKCRRIIEILDEHLERAQKTQPSFSRFFLGLLDEELVARIDRATENRIKLSALPDRPSLDTFDFAFQPSLDKRVVLELAERIGLDEDGDNIVFTGDTGTGKSHLAKALLLLALVRGKTGLFIDAQELVDRLFESQADRSTQRLLRRLARLDVLLIDEAGYLTLEPSQPNLLFRLISLRCERKAPIIITSNLLPDDLVARMAAPEITKALRDRLLHRCVHIHINGPSYREAQAKKRRAKKPSAAVEVRA